MQPPRGHARPIPSFQIVGDFVVLLVLLYELVILFSRVLGIHDPLSVAALTLGCLSQAAARLVSVRRGVRPALRPAASAIAMACCAPWCLLVTAYDGNPAALTWRPVPMLAVVRLVSVALALAVIFARPFWAVTALNPADAGGPRLIS